MKVITINLYSIDELSKEVQEKALETYRQFNVDDDCWYDLEFDEFTALCKSIGIMISINGIYFSGFYHQGSGSTFESTIDEIKFINGINSKAWKKYDPSLELNFQECPCDKRVIGLIENGFIECNWCTKNQNRDYWIDLWTDYDFIPNRQTELTNIYKELEKLDKWLKHGLNTLNNYLYQSLRELYDFQTSDEALKESFMANEILFTEDGKMAERLLDFAID